MIPITPFVFFTASSSTMDSSFNVKRSLVGDLSAILIENVNPLVNLIRVPDKKIALLSDFEEKVERITRATMNQNVTNLSGVPSWMMAVLKHILEVKGTDNLAEVWPDLEVFFSWRGCFYSLSRTI